MGINRDFSEKYFYCVVLPELRDFKEMSSLERKPLSTMAYSSQQAVSQIIYGANPKRVGVIMIALQNRHGRGKEKKDVSRFAINVSRLEDHLGVLKIKGSFEQIHENFTLPEVSDEELIRELVSRLGGYNEDYNQIIDKYNSFYSHR
jgi:hypothetical protein